MSSSPHAASFRRPRRLAARLLPAAAGWLCLAATASAEPQIRLELRDGRQVVVAADIGEAAWSRLPDPLPAGVLSLYAAKAPGGDPPPVFGRLRRGRRELVFVPKYPLLPGLPLRAELRLPGADSASGKPLTKPLTKLLEAPRPEPQGPPPTVEQIYPTQQVLPENQLKFYLHFSAPMRQGDAYRRIRLLRADGSEVDYPFLRLEPELWDNSGRRLTLLLDPGRVKRGLRPREESGQPLVRGESYRLMIDGRWRGADGRPLRQPFVKKFRAAAPDHQQPAPAQWTIGKPRPGSRQPLTVEFHEPLDHAMLQRVLHLAGPDGERVAGEASVSADAASWLYVPRRPWQPGRYELLVESSLEDLAGNSLLRPFEVDEFREVKPQPRRVERLPLRIR